jgi:hypothetical protein
MELVGKIIDKILDKIINGLLEPFIETLFNALGLDELLAKLPGEEWFEMFRSGVEDVGGKVLEKLTSYYDDIRSRLVKFLDVR